MKFKKRKNWFIVIFVFNWGYVNFLLPEDANDRLFGLICTRIVPSLNEYLTWPPKLLHKVAWKMDHIQGRLPVSSTCFLMWENANSRDPVTQWSHSSILYEGHILQMGMSRLIRRSQWQSPHWNPHLPTHTAHYLTKSQRRPLCIQVQVHTPLSKLSVSPVSQNSLARWRVQKGMRNICFLLLDLLRFPPTSSKGILKCVA